VERGDGGCGGTEKSEAGKKGGAIEIKKAAEGGIMWGGGKRGGRGV